MIDTFFIRAVIFFDFAKGKFLLNITFADRGKISIYMHTPYKTNLGVFTGDFFALDLKRL